MPDYITRFVRADGQPDEEYFFHTADSAREHLDLFADDDSGLYSRIEVVQYSTDTVLYCKAF